jgi:hypothetical protein
LVSCDTTPLELAGKKLTEDSNASDLRCTYRDHAGQQRHCRLSARPIIEKQTVVGYRGTASDITDEVAAHAQIQHLSMHDALTGLPNRNQLARYLDEALLLGARAAAVAAGDRPGQLQADQRLLGHPAGDAVLQKSPVVCANALASTTSSHAWVATNLSWCSMAWTLGRKSTGSVPGWSRACINRCSSSTIRRTSGPASVSP